MACYPSRAVHQGAVVRVGRRIVGDRSRAFIESPVGDEAFVADPALGEACADHWPRGVSESELADVHREVRGGASVSSQLQGVARGAAPRQANGLIQPLGVGIGKPVGDGPGRPFRETRGVMPLKAGVVERLGSLAGLDGAAGTLVERPTGEEHH